VSITEEIITDTGKAHRLHSSQARSLQGCKHHVTLRPTHTRSLLPAFYNPSLSLSSCCEFFRLNILYVTDFQVMTNAVNLDDADACYVFERECTGCIDKSPEAEMAR
jgi:hypothetical protein